MRTLKSRFSLSLLAACLLTSALPAHAAGSTTAVEAAIDARERAFEVCAAKGDAACAVNGFYVSDANKPVASPPGHPPVRGRAELIKMFEGAFKDLQSLRLERLEVVHRGELAVELGLSHVTLKSGEMVTGRFSVVWLREADGWRAKLDFFADDGWKQ